MSGIAREARLHIRVTPRGGRDSIDGVQDHTLRVRVAASPVDGAANVAAVRLIAAAVGVPPSAVRIAGGATGRRKVVAIEGLEQAALIALWPDLGV